MPTERIGDYGNKIYKEEERKICLDREHNPPKFMYFPPGRYRHTCPSCGKVTEFEVFPEGATL